MSGAGSGIVMGIGAARRCAVMRVRRDLAVLVFFTVSVAACAPATPSPAQRLEGAGSALESASAEPGRTLVAVVGSEPQDVAVRGLRERGVALFLSKRLFNANLALLDERSTAHPYLAEALPQLDTDSWRVFPDGRMETTWRLKPGIVWHDGVPLSAEDFAFAWRVYSTPQLGVAATAPMNAIESVTAPDQRTVLL